MPFTSGYWSKHAVVEGCIHGEVRILGAIVVCMSVLVTSFYTFRLMYLLFFSGQQNPFAKVEVPYSGEGFSSRLFVFIPLHLLGIARIKVGPYLHRSFRFVGAPVHSPVWFRAVRLVMTAGGGLLALVGNPWVTGGLRWSFLNKKSSKRLYKYSNVPDAH